MGDEDVRALLSDVGKQAETDRDRILAEAEARIGEIVKQSEIEAKRLEEEAELELERRVSRERSRLEGVHRMRRQSVRLEASREALTRVFDAAAEQLRSLCRSDAYPSVLETLLEEALEAAGGDADVTVSVGDEALARDIVKRKGFACTVRSERNEPGTLIAVSRDGFLRVDNSILTRLGRAEEGMEREVVDELFGNGR